MQERGGGGGGGGGRGREDVAAGTTEDDPVIVTTQHLSIPARPHWGQPVAAELHIIWTWLDCVTDVHVGLQRDHVER